MLPISNKSKLLEIFNVEKEIIINENLKDTEDDYIKSNDAGEEISEEIIDSDMEDSKNNTSILKVDTTLNTDKEQLKQYVGKEVNILLINKIEDAVLPFNCFLLEKQHNEICFLKMKLTDALIDNVVSKYVSITLNKNSVEIQNNLTFLGFKEDSIPTIVYNYVQQHENVLLTRDSKYWWVLPDEIINLNNVCNFKINKEVYDFFINNNELIYLYDEKNEKIQVPQTVYYGTEKKMLNYNTTFGIQKSEKSALIGPFYYFTNYINAIKKGGWSAQNEKHDEGGIIRFAVFPLKTYSFVYHPKLSKQDNSDIRKEIEKTNPEYVQKTGYYRDHNGDWSNEYDSAYLGPMINKDTGEVLSEYPYFVTKNNNQQMAISYHMLDLKNFGEKHENTKSDYYIL